jgi:uncharacterized membrane protein
MRHALVAESSKRKIHDRIAQLRDDIDKTENRISDLEAFEKDIIKKDQDEREEFNREHAEFKKEMGLVIYEIKD